MYAGAKIAFNRLAAAGTQMPGCVAELVSRLQKGGAFWALARNLYERAATKPADDATVQRFYGECAPFRALMIALFAAQFDRCIRSPNISPSLKAGRNDTFMATGLPYCDEFVTNDSGQLACYREVISLAGLDLKLRSYEEFRSGFTAIGNATGSVRDHAVPEP